MFHTFSAVKADASLTGSASTRRKHGSVRACDECRRRKIRCDGQRPCESCQWYQRIDLCRYQDPHVQDRQTASAYERIVHKLFPNRSASDFSALADRSPLELFDLARQSLSGDNTITSRAISPPPDPQTPPRSVASGDLETLQMMPEQGSNDQRDINDNNQDMTTNFSDDVNALALSSKPPSSYLGASSIAAILKVITWLQPRLCKKIDCSELCDPMQYSSPVREVLIKARNDHPGVLTEQTHYVQSDEKYLIDAFFLYFHPHIPIVDETMFHETFLKRQRSDSRWISLLNIVLALGSIAVTPADNKSHYVYFLKSKSHLDLTALGSPHVETVQTLGLMGGQYLHYISQPNLAYSLMGAALRMATSLGLHKEFANHDNKESNSDLHSNNIRRQVWWSLICLDTWGTETLGRPSLGRWSAGITAKLPHCSVGNDQFFAILTLIENVRYCRITTQIHEAMAIVPLLAYSEIKALDRKLVEWFENLPPLLKDFESCPEPLEMTRTVLRWRYTVQRMHLYRPALLSYAMRRIPYAALRTEECSAINTCMKLAIQGISDMGASFSVGSSQILGWPGVWMIFQAVMVPLLTLCIDDQTNPYSTTESHSSIEIAIAALVRMQAWSPTGSRTLNFVCSIYDGCIGNATGKNTPRAEIPAGTQGSSIPMQNSAEPSGFTPTHSTFDLSLMRFPPNFVGIEDNFGDEAMWDFITWSDDRLAQSLMQLDAQMYSDQVTLDNGISPQDHGEGDATSGQFC